MGPLMWDALGDVDAQGFESGQSGGVFYALGHDGQAEVVPEVQGALHDDGVTRVVGHGGDEGLVDPKFVYRKVFEVRQRAVACAVVVHGQADVHVPQSLEDVMRHVGISHDRSLRELNSKKIGGDLGMGEPVLDDSGEVGAEQAAGADVDGHGQPYLRVQGRDLAARKGEGFGQDS